MQRSLPMRIKNFLCVRYIIFRFNLSARTDFRQCTDFFNMTKKLRSFLLRNIEQIDKPFGRRHIAALESFYTRELVRLFLSLFFHLLWQLRPFHMSPIDRAGRFPRSRLTSESFVKFLMCSYERAGWLGYRDLGFSNRDLGYRDKNVWSQLCCQVHKRGSCFLKVAFQHSSGAIPVEMFSQHRSVRPGLCQRVRLLRFKHLCFIRFNLFASILRRPKWHCFVLPVEFSTSLTTHLAALISLKGLPKP